MKPVAAGVRQRRGETALNLGAVNIGQAYSRGLELANVVTEMFDHNSKAPQSQDHVLMLCVRSEPHVVVPMLIEDEVAKRGVVRPNGELVTFGNI
jgi:hypothetical protein